MSAVPAVCNRLMWTICFSITSFIIYNLFGFFLVMILLLFPIVIGVFGKGVVVFLLVLFAILYIIEFVYVTVVWQISSVAAALEDYHGFITPEVSLYKSQKSKELIKGKKMVLIFVNILAFHTGGCSCIDIGFVPGDGGARMECESFGRSSIWGSMLLVIVLFVPFLVCCANCVLLCLQVLSQ